MDGSLTVIRQGFFGEVYTKIQMNRKSTEEYKKKAFMNIGDEGTLRADILEDGSLKVIWTSTSNYTVFPNLNLLFPKEQQSRGHLFAEEYEGEKKVEEGIVEVTYIVPLTDLNTNINKMYGIEYFVFD